MTYSMFGCESVIAQICLVSADIKSAKFFGISEYLSACAILFVVLTVSDFRYKFRLEISFVGRKGIFIVAAAIGLLLALSELWFSSGWPVPSWANNLTVVQACLGGSFLVLVLFAGWVVFVSPPVFSELNARRFASAYYTQIGGGDRSQLAVLATELEASVRPILDQASQVRPDRKPRLVEQVAWDLLAILADRRFCKALVESGAWTIEEIFLSLSTSTNLDRLRVSELTTNISAELLTNPVSPLVAELEAFSRGYFEELKPITAAVYGDSDLVEGLSRYSGPLDIWRTLGFDPTPAAVSNYKGALAVFCESYFSKYKRPHLQSHTLRRALTELGRINLGLYRLNNAVEGAFGAPELQKLEIVTDCITSVIGAMNKNDVRSLDGPWEAKGSIHELIAKQYVEVILHAASISGPPSFAWQVHHNTVWTSLFGLERSKNSSTIQRLARRRILDEIREMEKYPNYRGARLLGFVLSIYGVSSRRHHVKNHHALKPVILNWVRRNYLRIRRDYPDVAQAVLIGSITYDEERRALVKTYTKGVEREPAREYLDLDAPN